MSKHTSDEKKMFREIFWSSFILENSYNYERQQALGFALGMWPAIKRIYKDKTSRAEALTRHMQIFNTAPFVVSIITGIAASIEKEAEANKDFDKASINNVKVALMGPLAGIGDSFFWGTLRILATALALPMASQGSFLAPILFLLVFNIPSLFVRYYGGVLGYSFGTKLLDNISESSIFKKLSKAATIVGLVVIGAMSAQMVKLETIISFSFAESSITVQSFLDKIFPLLLPFLFTLLCYYMIAKKKISSAYVLLFTVIIGILGSLLNVF